MIYIQPTGSRASSKGLSTTGRVRDDVLRIKDSSGWAWHDGMGGLGGPLTKSNHSVIDVHIEQRPKPVKKKPKKADEGGEALVAV